MRNIYFIALLFVCQYLFSQEIEHKIKEIKQSLPGLQSEKEIATAYSDLCWYYSNIQIDSSFKYGKKALEISEKIKDSSLISQVYSDLGSVYFKNGNISAAIKNYNASKKIRLLTNDKRGVAKVEVNLGNIYQTTGQLEQAMKLYINSLHYFNSQNDEKTSTIINANLGALYYEQKNYKKSLETVSKSYLYFEEKNMVIDLCRNSIVMGNIYLAQKDTLKAKTYYEKAKDYCKQCSDKITYTKAMNNILQIENLSEKKKQNLIDSIHLNRKTINAKDIIQKSNINLATLLYRQKKYNDAKNEFLRILNFYKKSNEFESKLMVYEYLSRSYNHLNIADSADYYFTKYQNLSEEIQQKKALAKTADLELKYRKETEKNQILQKNNVIRILVLLLISMVLIGSTIYIFRRKKQKLEQENHLLEIETLKINSKLQLQEQKLEISKELHDNIGSQLTFINAILESLRKSTLANDEKTNHKIETVSDFTKNTITELRDTIWVLNPKNLTGEELESRMRNFISNAENASEQISFQKNITIHSLQTFSSKDAITILRIFQEIINNAIKHSESTLISADIKTAENFLLMEIMDNGIGFNPEITTHETNGILNLKTRIKDVNGTLNIVSNSEIGTKYSIKIPLK